MRNDCPASFGGRAIIMKTRISRIADKLPNPPAVLLSLQDMFKTGLIAVKALLDGAAPKRPDRRTGCSDFFVAPDRPASLESCIGKRHFHHKFTSFQKACFDHVSPSIDQCPLAAVNARTL